MKITRLRLFKSITHSLLSILNVKARRRCYRDCKGLMYSFPLVVIKNNCTSNFAVYYSINRRVLDNRIVRSFNLRVRFEVSDIDTLDQLLRHLDNLLSACCNRQQIIGQSKTRDLGMRPDRRNRKFIRADYRHIVRHNRLHVHESLSTSTSYAKDYPK